MVAKRGNSCQSGDAPHPRADALFSEDFDSPDVPRGSHMGAAAEFGAGTGHGHQTYFFAVFLVKQGLGPLLPRFVQGGDLHRHGSVFHNFFIDKKFDSFQIFAP